MLFMKHYQSNIEETFVLVTRITCHWQWVQISTWELKTIPDMTREALHRVSNYQATAVPSNENRCLTREMLYPESLL